MVVLLPPKGDPLGGPPKMVNAYPVWVLGNLSVGSRILQGMKFRDSHYQRLHQAREVLGVLREQLHQEGSWNRMWNIDDALAVLNLIETEWNRKSGNSPMAQQLTMWDEKAGGSDQSL